MPQSQHYIPQFYLKQFTDPETPKGHQSYLWIYEFESHKWQRRAPKNIASKPDFYTFLDEDGKRRDEIEKDLSTVEAKTASLCRHKIANRQPLEDEERAIMAQFLALMMTRVPRIHNKYDSFLSKIMADKIEMYKARPEALKALQQRYEKDTGRKLPEDFDASYFDPSRYRISVPKKLLLEMMISPIQDLTNIIYRMTWTLLHTAAPAWFITSDSPFSMWNPKSNSSWHGHGLLYQDIEVCLPLSREISLLATWNEEMQRQIDLPQGLVAEVNRSSIVSADRFIFSPRKNFIGSQYLKFMRKQKRDE